MTHCASLTSEARQDRGHVLGAEGEIPDQSSPQNGMMLSAAQPSVARKPSHLSTANREYCVLISGDVRDYRMWGNTTESLPLASEVAVVQDTSSLSAYETAISDDVDGLRHYEFHMKRMDYNTFIT